MSIVDLKRIYSKHKVIIAVCKENENGRIISVEIDV